MDQGKYIWCRNCSEIHHVTPFDRSPMYILEAGEEKVVSMDDWRAFMQRHDGHKLEALQAFGMNYNPGIPPLDPMKERYIEVTNGQGLRTPAGKNYLAAEMVRPCCRFPSGEILCQCQLSL